MIVQNQITVMIDLFKVMSLSSADVFLTVFFQNLHFIDECICSFLIKNQFRFRFIQNFDVNAEIKIFDNHEQNAINDKMK